MTDWLAYARELEAEDVALAGAAAEVDTLGAATSALRARAEHAGDFLARLPEARQATAAAVAEAERELERRLAELRAAEAELGRVSKEEALLAARRAVVRNRDLVAGAERKLERLQADGRALEAEAREVGAELPGLEPEAAELAGRIRAVGRAPEVGPPARGPAGVAAWAARAEGALFVARSGLETERERVIRQANELGASAFGEPLVSASVSLVRERLERLSA